MIITSCGNSISIAKSLAKALRAIYSPLTISTFPDGDLYLKYNAPVKGKTVVIVHSFQPNPNESLLNVVFAAKTAKDLGAKKVILAAPYLAFMRQDKRFNPGEAVSAEIMAELLNKSVDELITIDPHLHRHRSLKELFTIKAKALTANPLITTYIERHFQNIVLIGPDWESYQWASSVAKKLGATATVLEKKRLSSRKVEVRIVNPIPMKGKNVIIVDDIISTGHTIAEAARLARKMGAKSITAIAVHGLLVENAVQKLKKAGVTRIITTNCIEHDTNKIDVTSLLVEELKD